MEVDLHRKYLKPGYSIGRLSVDGVYLCDTLEDPDRGLKKEMDLKEIAKIKIKGDTAIPVGRYELEWSYSAKFKRMMLLVKKVPGYDGIRIHSGNTAKDTMGCLLPGKNTEVGKVTNSRTWTKKLEDMVVPVLKKEKVYINIHW